MSQSGPFSSDSQLSLTFKVSFISSHPGRCVGDRLDLVLGFLDANRGFSGHGVWKTREMVQATPSPATLHASPCALALATKLIRPPCPISCCSQPDLSQGSFWRDACQSLNLRSLSVVTGTQVGAWQREHSGGPKNKRKYGRQKGGGEKSRGLCGGIEHQGPHYV